MGTFYFVDEPNEFVTRSAWHSQGDGDALEFGYDITFVVAKQPVQLEVVQTDLTESTS